MKVPPVISLLLAVALLGCPACKSLTGAKIDVELKNESASDIQEAEIYFGKYFVFGEHCFVGKGYGKVYINYSHIDGSAAEVEWTREGTKHKETVDFKKVLSERKSGELIFTVFDDHAEVSFKAKP